VGFNTALFPNISTEACFLTYGLCPNGKNSMAGTGAANTGVTPNASLSGNGFFHGTEIASIINKVNPGINIIPIRVVGMAPNGLPLLSTPADIKNALDWVVANQSNLTIVGVNISMAGSTTSCSAPAGMSEDIDALKAVNVPVIVATGNNSVRTAMAFPACLPNVISVGATDNPAVQGGIAYDINANPTIARYSNGSATTSFYLNGRWMVKQPDGSIKFSVGTSCAAAGLSGWWSLNNKGTYSATFNWLMTSTVPTSNTWLSGRFIPLPWYN
jgi:hypothetical protein